MRFTDVRDSIRSYKDSDKYSLDSETTVSYRDMLSLDVVGNAGTDRYPVAIILAKGKNQVPLIMQTLVDSCCTRKVSMPDMIAKVLGLEVVKSSLPMGGLYFCGWEVPNRRVREEIEVQT